MVPLLPFPKSANLASDFHIVGLYMGNSFFVFLQIQKIMRHIKKLRRDNG